MLTEAMRVRNKGGKKTQIVCLDETKNKKAPIARKVVSQSQPSRSLQDLSRTLSAGKDESELELKDETHSSRLHKTQDS